MTKADRNQQFSYPKTFQNEFTTLWLNSNLVKQGYPFKMTTSTSQALSAEELILESVVTPSMTDGADSADQPFRVPEGLRAILNELSKEVLRLKVCSQPN